MSKFFHGTTALVEPIHVRPFLGDPDKHWRAGASAFELATSWIGAGGIPNSVRAVLDSCPDFEGLEFLKASMEHTTSIPGRGFASQTDALVHADSRDGRVVISVEGKVLETFDKLVVEWASGEPTGNRKVRIDGLKQILGLDADVLKMRYQLLHRTAASILEARACGAKHAVMLVHSFCVKQSSFGDFQTFASAMGMPVADVNMISQPRQLEDVTLRLGWVADAPAPSPGP